LQYMGSKNKISQYIIPIIESYMTADTNGYLEPFVGGANLIDKIKCKKKLGCDSNSELIELLKKAQTNDILPTTISEEEYLKVKNNKEDYAKWYVGFVGFFGSFGAKYWGGFARRYKKDGSIEDVPAQAIRSLEKQRPNLEGITFLHKSFQELPKDKINGYIIYCDPPYEGTTKYKTNAFPHKEFWQWCREMSQHNTVLISEYNAPDDFICIWDKEHKTSLNTQSGEQSNRLERLYIHVSKYKQNSNLICG